MRREKVVGYLLGCMGLGVKKPTGGDDSKAEEAEPETGADVKVSDSDRKEQEAMKALEEQAQKIKLEQDEKKQNST